MSPKKNNEGVALLSRITGRADDRAKYTDSISVTIIAAATSASIRERGGGLAAHKIKAIAFSNGAIVAPKKGTAGQIKSAFLYAKVILALLLSKNRFGK